MRFWMEGMEPLPMELRHSLNTHDDVVRALAYVAPFTPFSSSNCCTPAKLLDELHKNRHDPGFPLAFLERVDGSPMFAHGVLAAYGLLHMYKPERHVLNVRTVMELRRLAFPMPRHCESRAKTLRHLFCM